MDRQQWEHRVRTVEHYADIAEMERQRGDVREAYDIGERGWELVSVVRVPSDIVQYAAFFKRPKLLELRQTLTLAEMGKVSDRPTYEARDDD